MGANKVIHYLSQNKPTSVVAYILLGAPDMAYEVETIENKDELLEEARANIAAGKPDKILTKLIWNYYLLSSERFVDLVENENSHNLPISSRVGSFDALESIKLPLLAIAGEHDDSCSSDIRNYLSLLIKKAGGNGVYSIIKEAGHTYTGKEYQLFENIYSYISTLN